MSRAPGVEIQYAPSQSLSISIGAAMSVPVFVGPFICRNNHSDRCMAIDNWRDFQDKFVTDNFTVSIAITSTPPEVSPPEKNKEETQEEKWTYSHALRAVDNVYAYQIYLYFLNGGGRCYILPLELEVASTRKKRASQTKGNEDKLAELPKIISGYPDITLLVWCGDDGDKADVYQSFFTLLSDDKHPYFLLTDVKKKDETPVLSDNASVGVWGPHVTVEWHPLNPDDEQISLTGYMDEKTSEEGTEDPTTLAALKIRNDLLYNELRTAVDQKVASVATEQVLSPVTLVAGQFAKVERLRGIWWSPAGMDVVLQGISGVYQHLSEDEHASLNEQGINVLRDFRRPTAGIRIFGARTRKLDDDWRFISARRLYQMIARDISSALQKIVFAPNTERTWNNVRSAAETYLHDLWQRGGLVGDHQEKAFFVRIGKGSTMSQTDINNGIMNVEIGFRAVRPAEFIVLRFSQIMAMNDVS